MTETAVTESPIQTTAAPFECVVSADLFRRAALACATDSYRPNLQGVQVEACPHGGVLMIATDGRRMLVIRDEDGYIANGSGIVRLTPTMLKALPTPRRKGLYPHLLAVRGKRAGIIERRPQIKDEPPVEPSAYLEQVDEISALLIAFQWSGVLIEMDYVLWRRVVPTPNPRGVVGSFNLTLAASLALALDESPKPTAVCRIVPCGDGGLSPILILPYEGQGIGFGILMPIRNATGNPQLPAWVGAAPEVVS